MPREEEDSRVVEAISRASSQNCNFENNFAASVSSTLYRLFITYYFFTLGNSQSNQLVVN